MRTAMNQTGRRQNRKKKAAGLIALAAIALGCTSTVLAAECTVAAESALEAESIVEAESVLAAESAMDAICEPSGIVAAADGTFLVTDTYNKVVWKVKDRVSTIYAGAEGTLDLYGEPIGGYNDSSLNQAYFKEPWAISPFLNGYAVSDSENNVVRLITPELARTATGTQSAGFVNGRGTKATFSRPTGLATDEEGSLYIADTNNNAIRKITTHGDVSTWAQNLSEPTGLCWKNGSLYVAESGGNRILKITGGQAEVVAGTGTAGNVIGAAAQAQFSGPQGVAVSDDGTIYVSDTGNNAVKKIQNGMVTTVIACNQQEMEPYPVAPRGLMLKDNQLYICDNFSWKVIVLPR